MEESVKLGLNDGLATLEFGYVNWRDEFHQYVVDVESFEFGEYGPQGKTGRDVEPRWVMNAHVVTRDGDSREDMGPTRRRTFLMEKMTDVERVA